MCFIRNRILLIEKQIFNDYRFNSKGLCSDFQKVIRNILQEKAHSIVFFSTASTLQVSLVRGEKPVCLLCNRLTIQFLISHLSENKRQKHKRVEIILISVSWQRLLFVETRQRLLAFSEELNESTFFQLGCKIDAIKVQS